MEYRESDYTSSKIKAMFGCISNHLSIMNLKSNDDYLTFLELCKIKGDFSFIYNTSFKRDIQNQKWKPLSYDFKPIYSWLYCYGGGQKGKIEKSFLLLEGIILKQRCNIGLESLNLLNRILNKDKDNDFLLEVIEHNLRELNFEGSHNPIEIENGYYFNQFEIEFLEEHSIGICTGIQWTFGAPAMLLKRNFKDGSYDFISSGVFFGKINKSEMTQKPLKIN
jgi:hypothetical protein